jgi:putative flavoprotein involved in K+ transport
VAAVPVERIETLVIGGGQAGLTMSHRLKQRGLAHLVLERNRIAERWRSERWDGLRFQFPNWSVRLPEFSFPHSDPDAFATSAEIVDFITAYAAFIEAPVRCGVTVTRLRRRDGASGFIAETANGTIEADNVVVATGPYQRALMPDPLHAHSAFQVHASHYRNPDQLPPGAVLVVGAGASGAQIAEELHRAGRHIYLSVGQHTRMPRRYRGYDLTWWFSAMRLFHMTAEQRGPIRVNPAITGADGGHTIDFRRFAADGITLLGRIQAARDGVLDIAPGLAESLANGDTGYVNFLDMMDAYVERHGLNLPDDPAARAVLADPPCVTAPLPRLDLRKERVGAVIWATGYGVDFGWIDIPVLDARGEPLHRGGITGVPGLYFLGLQWLSKMYSAFLSGVGDDAAVLADHIAARR